MYHLSPPDKLFLADRTLFILQEPNEKGLSQASLYCEDDTHAGVRAWYNYLSNTCRDYGFYAHPLWCFQANRGDERGFTIGDSANDDLPLRMKIPISRMVNPLFRLLSRRDMFAKSSRLSSIVRSSDGDGYKALKAILFQSHPSFYDQPSILIKSYPRQRHHTILEYYKLFNDFLQLRAFISNINTTLNDSTELDIFINNTTHAAYLNRVTRDERRLSTYAHKYTGSQLIETLEKHLMAPDSPVRMTPPPSVTSASRYTSSTTASSSSRSSIPTYRSRAKVHHVQSTSLPPSTSPTGIDVTNHADDPTDVSSIDVPDNLP